jgi:hypothetical protein
VTQDEMLGRATECRSLAAASRDLQTGSIFIDIAETWERLARQLDDFKANAVVTARWTVPNTRKKNCSAS